VLPVPRDVTVLQKTASTIRLQWTCGEVGGAMFWVWYRPSPTDSAAADDVNWIQSEKTSNTDCTVIGLEPATVYKLRVVAQNDIGHTQHSDIISCQTEDQPATLGTGCRLVLPAVVAIIALWSVFVSK